MPPTPCWTFQYYFYPRPPRGGRRHRPTQGDQNDRISIHALREEGDKVEESTRWADLKFLSTPSARRATFDAMLPQPGHQISIHALREEGDKSVAECEENLMISIHALREEGDCAATASRARPAYFYPRPPRGGRLVGWHSLLGREIFLSTPSARRATKGGCP